MSVTKKELIELVAKKGNLTNKAAKEAVKVFLNGIKDSLKRNEKVVITGFGTFSVRSRKQRKGRNPKANRSDNHHSSKKSSRIYTREESQKSDKVVLLYCSYQNLCGIVPTWILLYISLVQLRVEKQAWRLISQEVFQAIY